MSDKLKKFINKLPKAFMQTMKKKIGMPKKEPMDPERLRHIIQNEIKKVERDEWWNKIDSETHFGDEISRSLNANSSMNESTFSTSSSIENVPNDSMGYTALNNSSADLTYYDQTNSIIYQNRGISFSNSVGKKLSKSNQSKRHKSKREYTLSEQHIQNMDSLNKDLILGLDEATNFIHSPIYID